MPKFNQFLTSPVLTASMAVFCGTVMDAIIKYVTSYIDLVMVVFWRFALASVYVAIPFVLGRRRLPAWSVTWFHAFRGLIHVTAGFFFFYALGKLKLAEVTVVGFTAALLILPVARILLKEKVSPVSALAGIIGFSGVLVTVSGGDFTADLSQERLLGFGSVILSACLYALSIVLLRMRAALDGAFTVALYANLFPALFFAPVAFTFGDPVPLKDFPVLFFMAFFGMMIWIFMTSAYARAPAQRLAPVEYTALIWSALIGWLVFREIPTISLWLGAGLIIGACLIVIWQDSRASRVPGP